MLAYVFWHWPAVENGYEDALLSFHRSLAEQPPAGWRGSRVFRVGNRPWLAVPQSYEDWYFVDDFTALGALNQAAVSARHRVAHDAIAGLPAGGVGALYGHVRGAVSTPPCAVFQSKPTGESYAAYLAGLPSGAEVWQRQMVLGPAPEFCLLHPSSSARGKQVSGTEEALPIALLYDSRQING